MDQSSGSVASGKDGWKFDLQEAWCGGSSAHGCLCPGIFYFSKRLPIQIFMMVVDFVSPIKNKSPQTKIQFAWILV